MKIHHVGYLTKDLRASEKAFLKLGYEVEFPAAFDSLRDITITFFTKWLLPGRINRTVRSEFSCVWAFKEI